MGIVYGGNWFEGDIRVFIYAKHYENLITDIFQLEDFFFSKQYYFIDTIQNNLFQVREWSVDWVEAWQLLL